MSIIDQFVENARRVGFIVHDGDEGLVFEAEPSHAAYGLADTGSVVLRSCDEPRSRSLLPFVHHTYVAEDSILPGLAELFVELGTELPSCLAIVTGPSSSGDIEMTPVVGVHGPGEAHLVLVARAGSSQ
jgi:L-lactate dehydrogenase complex protein LldG